MAQALEPLPPPSISFARNGPCDESTISSTWRLFISIPFGISAGVPTATRMAPAQPVSPATLGMGIAGLGTSMAGSIYGKD